MGESPNRAFGWEQQGKRGRPRSFAAMRRQWMIGQRERDLCRLLEVGQGRGRDGAFVASVRPAAGR
jgi:hypothetical protein